MPHLLHVVWRDLSGDAHSNTTGPIDQQVRDPSRKDKWLILQCKIREPVE
jgi:hypothetical protein